MPQIELGRLNAEPDHDFVLFLIGMRFNRLWKVRKWWSVLFAMPKMLRELGEDPELGLLGSRVSRNGRVITVVQYWESAEKVLAFSRSPELQHRPYWKWFNSSVGSSGDVGIWHELYQIRAGSYEARYVNMPLFGLGAAVGNTRSERGIPD